MAKLLLVVPTLSSYEAFLSDFAEAAMAAGDEVHVATQLKLLDGRDVEANPAFKSGVHLHPISMPRGSNPFAALKAAKELRGLVSKIQPNWIQAHFSAAATVCAFAKSSDWPFTSCIIQGLACTLARGKAHLAAWCGERLAMARLDEMWVLTEDDFEVIRGWDSRKARLQDTPGFGCRIGRFNPENYSAKWRSGRRTELGIQPEECVLIYVGRLAAFKGFDQTVGAFNQICQRGSRVRLVVLGTFDALHPSGLSEAEVTALETNNRVILAGWQANVADWLSIADLCVFPSKREGMPVCLMESLSMGVPVITANSRGCRDVVRDGVDGVVMDEPSVVKLADMIEELIREPVRLEEMKQAALERRSSFDRKHYVIEHLDGVRKTLFR
jgi:glycosyltransferase involved in cell wall biosynthesis